MKHNCNICEKEVKKPYRIIFQFRDPRKVYQGTKLPFIQSHSKMYCHCCFTAIVRDLKKEYSL